jgi:transcriptional regulator of acetoin/glycerol metabolism
METFLLDEVRPGLWQEFQEARLAAAQGHEVEVLARWQRARAMGADPEGEVPEAHLVRGAELKERRTRTELLRHLASAVMDRAAAELAGRHHLLLLADPDGVVVATQGGGEFASHARHVRLIEGACWSEQARGTNAIGTALAEQRPVVVRGRAHYERGNGSLVCQASLVRDPFGEVVAVLDATSSLSLADPFVMCVVTTTAKAIEEMLRIQAYAGAGAGVGKAMVRTLDRVQIPALWIEAPGAIRQQNRRASVLFGGEGGAVEDRLGVGWSRLLEESRRPSPGGLRVALRGGGTARARVEPLEDLAGRPLALLVLLEPPGPPRTLAGAATLRPTPAPRAEPPRADLGPFAALQGEDPRQRRAVEIARKVAPSTLPVLLLSETGTGKELLARAIHEASPRARGPWVALNCGAIAPSLLESELFGHGPGAFTGADRQGHHGQLRAAHGGTLFLDEVGEMPPPMQAALLRALETGSFHRVGETQEQRVDVRLVCATCQDLPARVEAGTFRRDLYYRLKGVSLTLPPLRERTDLGHLASGLLAALARGMGRDAFPPLADETLSILGQHRWPGNIRELRTSLQVALVMAGDAPEIAPDHLPPDILEAVEGAPGSGREATDEPGEREGRDGRDGRDDPPASGPLGEVEVWAVRRVLAEVAGNVSAAARRLGVARSTIYRLLRRHGSAPP